MFVYVWGTWILSLGKSVRKDFAYFEIGLLALFRALDPQVRSDRSFVNTLCHSRITLLSTLWMVPFGVQNPSVFM